MDILWNDSAAAKTISKQPQQIQEIDTEIISNKYIWCGTQLFQQVKDVLVLQTEQIFSTILKTKEDLFKLVFSYFQRETYLRFH